MTLAVLPATPADADRVVEVVAAAFLHDPTWSWAFPDPRIRLRFWHLCVGAAIRYPWVFRTPGFEAVAIWIPPGQAEFSAETEAQIPAMLQEMVGERITEVTELWKGFSELHPQTASHYYLSLLATAPEHRGRGLGMALLKENLSRIDREGMPAYLESTNPINTPRYEALGFVPVVSFSAPGGGPTVTGMWRSCPSTHR